MQAINDQIKANQLGVCPSMQAINDRVKANQVLSPSVGAFD
jgi:hypothetical protein